MALLLSLDTTSASLLAPTSRVAAVCCLQVAALRQHLAVLLWGAAALTQLEIRETYRWHPRIPLVAAVVACQCVLAQLPLVLVAFCRFKAACPRRVVQGTLTSMLALVQLQLVMLWCLQARLPLLRQVVAPS